MRKKDFAAADPADGAGKGSYPLHKKERVPGSLTEGVIWKQLLLFALPLPGYSFIQQLYNTVDLLFAGNLIGKNATAAVGASSQVIKEF